MSEATFHKALVAVALLGLFGGIAASLSVSRPDIAAWIWTGATVPVIIALAVTILRDFLTGRVGVDAIALVSMSAAIALGQPLAAIVVAIMYSGGNLLEDFARGRAERDLRALTDRTPRIAHRRSGDEIEDVPVSDVRIGDCLLVRAGELLPVDGTVSDDLALIDESAVTGEPLPVKRSQGTTLRSGTVNVGETFGMVATASADDSTYAGIVKLVRAAQTAKAPFIRMADRFALVLLPITLAVAGAAWFWSGDPLRALAVLVVATPCPLILAAPVALIGGVARGASMGILMKGGSALEALAQVTTVIFDKTGTLTEGGATLIAARTAPGVDSAEVLRLVASLEQASHHGVAAALVDVGRARRLALVQPSQVKEDQGSGIEGVVDGKRVRAGSAGFVTAGIDQPDWARTVLDENRDKAVLTVFVAIDSALAAILILGDGLRSDTAAALSRLRHAGMTRMLMVTGDEEGPARAIGATLDLDAILAKCSPAQKVDAVAGEEAGARTMMVGDGINDAPALAAATVGVAMGARGATASSEAADVVILADRLELVADAVTVARRAKSIALQSIVVGLGLSGIAMVAAAFGYLSPVEGAVLQEGIDVAVILNALRARGAGLGGADARRSQLRALPSTGVDAVAANR